MTADERAKPGETERIGELLVPPGTLKTAPPRDGAHIRIWGHANLTAATSATFNAVSSVAPDFLQTAIISAEPALEQLRESVLYTCARDDLPVGPRIGILDVPEPTLKALANYELERRGRRRERVWWILGIVGTAALTALAAWAWPS